MFEVFRIIVEDPKRTNFAGIQPRVEAGYGCPVDFYSPIEEEVGAMSLS